MPSQKRLPILNQARSWFKRTEPAPPAGERPALPDKGARIDHRGLRLLQSLQADRDAPAGTLNWAASAFAAFFHPCEVVIYQLHEDGSAIDMLAAAGENAGWLRQKQTANPVNPNTPLGQVLLGLSLPEPPPTLEVNAPLLMPLTHGGAIAGAVEIRTLAPQTLTAEDREYLRLAGDWVAATWQRQHREEAEECRALLSAGLLDLAPVILQAASADQLLAAAASWLLDNFPVEAAYFLELEDGGWVIRFSAGGRATTRPVGQRREHAYGPWAAALAEPGIHHISGAEAAAALRHDLTLPPAGWETLVSVAWGGRVRGLLGTLSNGKTLRGNPYEGALGRLAQLIGLGMEALTGRHAAATGRPAHTLAAAAIEDTEIAPPVAAGIELEFVDPTQAGDPRAGEEEIVLPLMMRGRPVGSIMIDPGAGQWTPAEQALAERITRQAGTALEINQLLLETRKRVREQEKLSLHLQTAAELAAELGDVLDQKALLEKAIHLMTSRFALDGVGLFLFEPATDRLVLSASSAAAGPSLAAELESGRTGSLGPVYKAIENGRPEVRRELAGGGTWLQDHPEFALRSEAALPLRARGRVLGAISALSREPDAFTSDLIRVLQTMGDQIAIALDNSDLFQQLESRLTLSAQLNRAEKQLIEAETKAAIYRALVDFADNSGVFNAVRLIAPPSVGLPTENWPGTGAVEPESEPADRDGAGWTPAEQAAARLQSTCLLESPAADGAIDPALRSWLAEYPDQTVILMPILHQKEWLGTLLLAGAAPPSSLLEVTTALEGLCAQAGTALTNRDLLRETSALYGLSKALSQAMTQEDVGQITVREIVDYTRVDRCRIYLIGKDQAGLQLLASNQPAPPLDLALLAGQDGILHTFKRSRTAFILDRQSAAVADSHFEPIVEASGAAQSLVIPAYSQLELIDFIILDAFDPLWVFSQAQQRFAWTATEQFTVTYENMDLFDEALTRAQELVAVNQIGARIASTLEPGEIAEFIFQDLRLLIPHDYFAIGTLAGGRLDILLRREKGIDPVQSADAIEVNDALLQLARQGDTMIMGQEDPRFAALVSSIDTGEILARQAIFAPFVQENRPIGLLVLFSEQADGFTPNQKLLLRAVANQASLGFSNAASLRESKENVAELRTMFNVTQAVASSVTVEDRVQNTARTLHHSLRQAAIGIVSVLSDQRLQVIGRAGGRPEVPSTLLELNPTVYKQIFRQHKPVHLPGRFGNVDLGITFFRQCAEEIIMPLTLGQRTIGFLIAGQKEEAAFSERDFRLLQNICISLSATIESGRLFDQVQAANRKLQELDEMKTLFLANMSHELRTPLNSIIGFSRLILKGIDGPITEAQEEDLNSIHNSGQHLLHLINDILDLAKLDAGKMGLAFEAVDLKELAQSVLTTARGLVRDKPVDLKWDVADPLPIIQGDLVRLRQILLNLLSNAAKFTENGSITLAIRPVFEKGEEHFVQITVADTGIGIDRKDFSRLFAKFEQVDASPTRAISGTGLGLPIVYELVELHNGRIWVESEVGVGSQFHVILPINQVEGGNPGQGPAAGQEFHAVGEGAGLVHQPLPVKRERPRMPHFARGKPAILLVDDEPFVLTLYQRYLGDLPNEIVMAHSGSEALRQLRERPEAFGLVLLDIHMPYLSGWDVLREIREDPQLARLPVVVCSVDVSQKEAESHGAQLALTKPIISEDLSRVFQFIQAL